MEDNERDDEISIDLSKIKNIFERKKKKDLGESEGVKKEEEKKRLEIEYEDFDDDFNI